MKPHPRIRKTIEWGGAIVALAMVVGWVVGSVLEASWIREDNWPVHLGYFTLMTGITLATTDAWRRDGWRPAHRSDASMAKQKRMWRRAARVFLPLCMLVNSAMAAHVSLTEWRFMRSLSPAMASQLNTQVLSQLNTQVFFASGAAVLFALFAVAAVYWLRPRTHPAGSCPSCFYDRTGLAAGAVCPECGAAPSLKV